MCFGTLISNDQERNNNAHQVSDLWRKDGWMDGWREGGREGGSNKRSGGCGISVLDFGQCSVKTMAARKKNLTSRPAAKKAMKINTLGSGHIFGHPSQNGTNGYSLFIWPINLRCFATR